MAYDRAAFHALQGRLAEMWPVLTVRGVARRPRVLVVVSSLGSELPEAVLPMATAYEERYLFYLISLARFEHTRVIYVTSMPMLRRLADYYLGLVHGTVGATERLTVVSVGDPSSRPLSGKILDRPLLLERLRALVGDPRHGLLMPFLSTELEAELALALDVPLYAPDPDLQQLGTKSGSREVFARSGVPLPRGASRLRDRDDVVAALAELQRERPVRRAVVKTDAGFSGLGNAVVDLAFATERRDIARAVEGLTPEDPAFDAEGYLDRFARGGGVAEEWIEGDEIRSPSVQLRASPLGEVEVLSTHEQVLGGPGGHSYLGCTFPAADRFIGPLTEHGSAIGVELSARGVIGRFGIDFVMSRTDGRWSPYALEINLRNGGTTHPMLTLLALTDGTYDEATGRVLARTGPKFYEATDHLESTAYRALTPDDVLDRVAGSGLGWDPDTEVGVALHMVSGVAVAGAVGATAIANSPAEARRLMAGLRKVLDRAVAG